MAAGSGKIDTQNSDARSAPHTAAEPDAAAVVPSPHVTGDPEPMGYTGRFECRSSPA